MKVQKVEGKRLKPCLAHSWFAQHRNIWRELKAGKMIEIPDNEQKTIRELYGDSLKEIDKKLGIKKGMEVKNDS